MKPPNVLFLSEVFPPVVGGAEEYNRNLACAITGLGARVTVIAPRVTGARECDEILPFRVIRIGEMDIRHRKLGLFARWVAVTRTRKALEEVLETGLGDPAPDFAIVSPLSPWAASLERLNIPYCLALHGADAFGRRSDFLRTLYRKRVVRGRLLRAARIYTNSRYTASLLPATEKIGEKTCVTYCGVSPEITRLVGRKSVCDRHHADVRRFITMSRLVRFKATDTVIEAFGRVHAAYPDARLTIAGEGPERGNLERLAGRLGLADAVSFAGQIRGDREKVAALAEHDVFVQGGRHDPVTGRDENFGIVFVEAAVCGLPTIGARIGGIPEVVADGKTGILVDSEDVEGMANAMLRFVVEPSLADSMGKAGMARAAEKFSYEKIAERILSDMMRIRFDANHPPDDVARRQRERS